MDPKRMDSQRLKDVSERSLTVSYITALCIMAGLLIACHFIIEGELQISKRSGALINLSGRQRMLSQRIASMAAEYRLGVPGSRLELVRATKEFEDVQTELLAHVGLGSTLDPYEIELQDLSWRVTRPLVAESRDYIAQARHIASLPAEDRAQPVLLITLFEAARAPLLSDLDRAVTLRQKAAESRVTNLQHLQTAILSLALFTLVVIGLTIFKPMVRRITDYNEELVVIATTDQLTSVANRRSFIQSGAAEIGRSRRYGRPVSFLALDIDHFKLINDRFGHPAGDEALIAVAARLQQGLRSLDVLGRVGGEEFAILLPETAMVQATQVAERLRRSIASLQIRHAGKAIQVTVSIGVVEVSTGMATLSEVMSAADAALYQAKAGGRNCVVNAAA